MKKYKPCRDQLFQYAYDFGIEKTCEILDITDEKFWELLYPPVVTIKFPVYAKKEVPFNPELSDIITTSYPYLHKKCINPYFDYISQEDSLQDAIVIAMHEFGLVDNPDREEVRSFIIKKFYSIEYFLKLTRKNFNSDEA